MSALEHHRIHRIGWLRAAVLGANDGIVSTASLIIGVAAAGATQDSILLAGVAGLVAGAMSMAAGEYVSVSSQSDTERADLELEKQSLEEDFDHEIEELALIYEKRGLDAGLSVMGRGVGLAGRGTLLTVVFAGADDSFTPGSGNFVLDLLDITNRELAFEINGTKASAVPLTFALAEAYPNPFNPQTTIKFSLPTASNVRLEIYGLDGRRVAILVNDELGPGAHEAIWRGRDDSGRAAASGVYFTKLTAGSLSQVRKMTLMK